MQTERLEAGLREYTRVLYDHALHIDDDPDHIHSLLASGLLPFRQFAGLPVEYNDDPLRIDGEAYYLTSCEERVVASEQLARGDASMIVGAPGASMSGVLIDTLASPNQKQRFYTAVASGPVWTFFALSEPEHGSDAMSIETVIDADQRLHGVKRYIGNAARAQIGAIFARSKPGPLGLGAVLIETDRPGFQASPLPALGMRGVQLSEIRLQAVEIEDDDVLGMHLSPSRRGILGAVKVFDKLRPVVGSLALGVAQAALDYLAAVRRELRIDQRSHLDRFSQRIIATRHVIRTAARLADRDRPDSALSASAKVMAVELAEEVTCSAPDYLGPGWRLDHPYLDKLVRDARGLEFMEGTATIQRLHVANGHLQRTPRPPEDGRR